LQALNFIVNDNDRYHPSCQTNFQLAETIIEKVKSCTRHLSENEEIISANYEQESMEKDRDEDN
jgi:hypothetical protein